MIIDCHTHVFENWHGACGHPSVDIHLKYIQKNVTRPAAKTFRVRDGEEVKPAMLFRPEDNTWAGLNDVGFRVVSMADSSLPMRARATRSSICR